MFSCCVSMNVRAGYAWLAPEGCSFQIKSYKVFYTSGPWFIVLHRYDLVKFARGLQREHQELRCHRKMLGNQRKRSGHTAYQLDPLLWLDEYYHITLDHKSHLPLASSFFPDCVVKSFCHFILEAVSTFPTASHYFTHLNALQPLTSPAHCPHTKSRAIQLAFNTSGWINLSDEMRGPLLFHLSLSTLE